MCADFLAGADISTNKSQIARRSRCNDRNRWRENFQAAGGRHWQSLVMLELLGRSLVGRALIEIKNIEKVYRAEEYEAEK